VPFCPKCGSEYEAGVERCVDCNEALVAHLPAQEQDTLGEMTDRTERLVQIAVFNHSVEAHLCKTRLESEGIECFLQGDVALNINLFGTAALDSLRLEVRESDAERAIEILKEGVQETGVEDNDTDGKATHGPCCPRCGSFEISGRKRSPVFVLLSLLLLGIPLLFMRTTWECRNCWHTWKAFAAPHIQRRPPD
jgi:hypothetical protein